MALTRMIALLGIAFASASCSVLPGEYTRGMVGEYTGELIHDGKKTCYYEAEPDGHWIGRQPNGTLDVAAWESCPATAEVY